MVNRSKINDPRFWEKWESSGAVEGLEEAFERNPEYKKFTEYITWIREGDIFLFEVAKRLAEKNGFSKEPLEKALERGVRKEYDSTLNFIREGKVAFWEREGRKLLEKYGEQYGLDPKRLEEAMREGAKKQYNSLLKFIEEGKVYFWEPRARELLKKYGKKYGLKPERLEEAVEIGMKYEIASKPPETGLEIIDYFGRRMSPEQHTKLLINYIEGNIKALDEENRRRNPFEEHLLEYD